MQEGDKETLDRLSQEWFGKDNMRLFDRSEVCLRLHDMAEAEYHPIADCDDCGQLGKVCFENDDGCSHRRGQGILSVKEMTEFRR